MRKYYWPALIVLIVLVVYILPIGGRPLVSPDETRNAEIAREMVESGNFITPTLNGVRYFEKPPLSYWCSALSFRLFGQNPFALRLPCILVMLGTALMVYLLTARFYDRKLALIATTIFATYPLVFVLGTVAITDMYLTFFVTATMTAYFFAIQEGVPQKRRLLLLFLAGILSAFAFLSKGFIAFAIPVICIVPYLIWDRKWKLIFSTPWLPLLGAVLVLAPWGIAIHRQEPDFWHYFFFVEHVQRFFGGEKAQHENHIFYFIPVFLGGVALWVIMLPDVFKGVRRQISGSPLLKFALCSFVMPFLFFSLSSGKLATYILPCFAPFAILTAGGLQKTFIEEKREFLFRLTIRIFWVLLFLTVTAVLVNLATGFPQILFMKHEAWKGGLIVLAAGLWATGMRFSLLVKEPHLKLLVFMASLFPVVIGANIVFPDVVAERKAPVAFLKSLRPLIPAENCIIVTNRRPFQDVCWVFKTRDMRMYGSPGEIEYGLSYPEAKHRFLKTFDDLEALIWDQRKKKGSVILVSRTDDFLDIVKKLPAPVWTRTTSPGAEEGFTVAQF